MRLRLELGPRSEHGSGHVSEHRCVPGRIAFGMNIHRVPPAWRLPEGVNAPLWEYVHTPRLAVEEDAYFAGHPLFAADAQDPRRTIRRPRAGSWTWAAARGGTRSGSPARGFSGRRRRPVAADAGDRRAARRRTQESHCCRSRRTSAAWAASPTARSTTPSRCSARWG